MQLPRFPSDAQFRSITSALQKERVGRYMAAAGGDQRFAFKLYLWNCLLCEAFVIPLHFSEIVCRNALHVALLQRGNPQWYLDDVLLAILADRYRLELQDAVAKERRQHGRRMTAHHVVSALSFGFWEHLTTKRFERYLWSTGICHAFADAPPDKTHDDLQRLIESVRRWRNRIAHHSAIFDRGPMKKHQDVLGLIRWCSADTGTWVASISRVPSVIAMRPRSA